MRGIFFMALIMSLLSTSARAADEPSFEVLLKEDNFEIRQYDSMMLAEVIVKGNMRQASSKGFRPLADFIFGNNSPAEKIEMTAPVTRKKSTKIQMTAPVTRVENDDETWTVAFVMPDKWTKETLPKPNNSDVTIREVASELIASIKFSGRGRESSHVKKQVLLEQWLARKGYAAIGEPRYAGYDAPWVPWPMRRNEVLIQVEKSSE